MSRLQVVLENSKKYLDLAERRSVFYGDTERALELVKNFIQERGRIIYGGMSIDLALKHAGHEGIYAADAIPDYDFMSPDFYRDSIELADILHAAGLPEVSSINALHVTTRRVRVNFVPVADITYIPEEIYNKIPTLEHAGFRVVHPDFQRLDMHRAFGYPFTDPPREPILHRAKKDQRRFTLLTDHYPIEAPPDLEARLKKAAAGSKTLEAPLSVLQNSCLGGIVAYGFLRDLIVRIAGQQDLGREAAATLEQLYPASTEVLEDRIRVTMPAGAGYLFNTSTDHFAGLVKKIAAPRKREVAYYNRFLDDLRPRTVLAEHYEIFDNKGKLLPCFNLQKLARHWLGLEGKRMSSVYLVQPPQVMLYFLQRVYDTGFRGADDLWVYWSLIKIAELAALAWTTIDDDYAAWPFFLSAYTYGEANWSPAYVLSISEKLRRIRGIPETDAAKRPVFGYYPDRGAPAAEFDPQQSELFLIDGKRREKPFEPLELQT